jgi:flagellin
MRIDSYNPNINRQNQINVNNNNQDSSVERLSASYLGRRLIEESASIAISDKAQSIHRGLTKASQNAQEGVTLVQIAQNGLQETQENLLRIREFAVQADSGEYTEDDMAAMQYAVDEIDREIDEISYRTELEIGQMLEGNFELQALVAKFGGDLGDTMIVNVRSLNAATLGVDDLRLRAGGTSQAATVDIALEVVSQMQSDLGVMQSRFESEFDNTGNSAQYAATQENRIGNAETAMMLSQLMMNSALFQHPAAMSAQANATPLGVLQLLG